MSLDVSLEVIEPVTVYRGNVTHNLAKMAEAAGLYQCLWHPDQLDISKAAQMIEPLSKGLVALEADRAKFERLNPPNGWGHYAGLVHFVDQYLQECKMNPEATVRVDL